MTRVRDDHGARERGFVGSPTILVDGEDVAPAGDEDVGLSCRLYRRRDGQISPTPGREGLREALLRATRGGPQEVKP
jgi:hypothetical protein